MPVPVSRIAAVVLTASLGILACAEGSKDDLAGATLATPPAAESTDEEIKVPPPSPPPNKEENESSSGSSGTSSGSSGTSGTSSGSSGTSGTSTSSSSGGAGGDCDPGDITYYLKAITELSGPSPQDCPCSGSMCCYGGLVCVPL